MRSLDFCCSMATTVVRHRRTDTSLQYSKGSISPRGKIQPDLIVGRRSRKVANKPRRLQVLCALSEGRIGWNKVRLGKDANHNSWVD